MKSRTEGRKKILITGATGQVARPIAEALAADHEIWALGRFSDVAAKEALCRRGVRTWQWDMGSDGLDGLPIVEGFLLAVRIPAVVADRPEDFSGRGRMVEEGKGCLGGRVKGLCRPASAGKKERLRQYRVGIGQTRLEPRPIGTQRTLVVF